MKYYVIDRFEENLAVCESNDGKFIHLPKSILPPDISEGSVIKETDEGAFVQDIELEEELRQQMLELQKQVFGDD